MRDVAAVVVTYNRCEMLLECVQRLLRQEGVPCDVLIVDNASTDDTAQRVEFIRSEQVHYRNTGKNIGGAGGFNFGIRWAVEEGYKRIWLMDDDTYPEATALNELIKTDAMLAGNYAFLSSAVLWKDGNGCIMNKPGIHRDYEKDILRLADGLIRVEQATFVSMFLNVDAVLRVGLPIREFFIWGDDIEYSRRMCVRNQMPAYLVGSSRVIHMMKENTGSNLYMDVPERIARYQLAFRNESYLYRQEGTRGTRYYIIRCAANFKNVLFRAKDYRLRRICALLSGMAKGIVFNPKVEYVTAPAERNEQQNGQ